jgi:energy-coupling factor transporter ATP-binding protein EcfA2
MTQAELRQASNRSAPRGEYLSAGSRANAALTQWLERIERPRALVLRVDERATLSRAAERVAAQLGGEYDFVLTIALAGGSGVGKSTIINALAGATIAEAAEQRPCTMQATVYHHRDLPDGGLALDAASESRGVMHDRSELRFKVIIDTPDLDTFATQNRAATRALLKAAGLVLYVFTPEKYWDERVWSVIREEQRFSSCLALLNKSDTVPASALERASEEIRRRFSDLGKPDIAVLRICAARHVPDADGRLTSARTAIIDEFATLRAYIEHELHDGDIVRMRRDLRMRVVDHLQQELERVLPQNIDDQLAMLSELADSQATTASDQLSRPLAGAFSNIEADLRPLIDLRRHQLFSGPFRAWLSACDFMTYGLPRVLRRLRALGNADPSSTSVMEFSALQALEQFERAGATRVRDQLFNAGLPVERWRPITEEPTSAALPDELMNEIQNRFEAASTRGPARVKWVARTASTIGGVIPVLLSAYALWTVVSRLAGGQTPGGFDMLALVFSLTILSYVVLHSLVSLSLLGTRPAPIHDLGRQATHALFARKFRGWVARYRSEIEEDLEALRAPLATLSALAQTSIGPASVVPSNPSSAGIAASAIDIYPALENPAKSERERTRLLTKRADQEPQKPSANSPGVEPTPLPEPERSTPIGEEQAADSSNEPSPLRPSEIFRKSVERHAAKSSDAK